MALLGSLNAVGQRLPAGQHVCGHRIQNQHPVQTGVAVHSGELLGHPATARIAMGAHQSGTPTMASQQPVTIKPLHRHQTIAQLHEAVDEQGGCQGDQRPAAATGPFPQQPGQQAEYQQGNHPQLGTSCEQLCPRPVADPAGHGDHQARQLMNRPQQQGQHSRRPHKHQQRREHGEQRERRQQRGNEKIGNQGVQRHCTEVEQLERERPDQRRQRNGARRCQPLAAIWQPRLNSPLEAGSREDQPSGGRRTELKTNR